MAIIEGIGDELVVCVIVAVIVILLVAAWQSTFVGDNHRVVTIREQPNQNIQQQAPTVTIRAEHQETGGQPSPSSSSSSPAKENKASTLTQEQTVDRDEKSEEAPRPVPSGGGGCDEGAGTSGISSTSTTCHDSVEPQPARDQQQPTSTHTDSNKICIKVKFLNDTEREIETSLSETVGEFRRKNFVTEMSANHRVRFIFNGQVLASNVATLQDCGISDNSIMHCLLSPLTDANTNQNSNNSPVNYNELDADIDIEIGTFVMPLLGAILLSIWYFRLEYDEYFNHTSTLSLSLLTAIYGAGMYLVWRGTWGGNNNNDVVNVDIAAQPRENNAQPAQHNTNM